MYTEEELLPISALQHLAFCARQWGLIHIEQQWAENRFTAEGRLLHDTAHSGEEEFRDGTRFCRGLRLRSLRVGLSGVADVVEFHPVPFPVEYKRGRAKPDRRDEVQLCAQALCLEEMLACSIQEGALYYGQPRRRSRVRFDEELRAETERLAVRLHELTLARRTPPPEYGKKCASCSLLEICQPKVTSGMPSAARYLKEAVAAALKEGGEA